MEVLSKRREEKQNGCGKGSVTREFDVLYKRELSSYLPSYFLRQPGSAGEFDQQLPRLGDNICIFDLARAGVKRHRQVIILQYSPDHKRIQGSQRYEQTNSAPETPSPSLPRYQAKRKSKTLVGKKLMGWVIVYVYVCMHT